MDFFQNINYKPNGGLDKEVAAGCLDVLVGVEVELGDGALLEEGGVAQVVRHHDGGVQRGEIQRRNRHVVVSFRAQTSSHQQRIMLRLMYMLNKSER